MVHGHSALIDFIKSLYSEQDCVPLHAPVFMGNEKKYMQDCIDTTFVSYIGKYVTQFEEITAAYTGSKYAVAFVNGTAALQIALQVAGVNRGDEVITQALTFVATANAITHAGGNPVFVDVDRDSLGMSPKALSKWLEDNVIINSGSQAINRTSGRPVSAIVPMHTFGNPCRIDEIIRIADEYNIPVIEDAAESLGSTYKQKHTGTFGLAGILSYNGNKTITAGGGGMIITDDYALAVRARHISTTAKIPHKWEFAHDELGYNFRLNNVCASIGVAQMEKLDSYLTNKRRTAESYAEYCRNEELKLVGAIPGATPNNWLNAIVLGDREDRDAFLDYSNEQGVMARPIWNLMNKLGMFKNCQHDGLENSIWLEDRIVNIPSGVRTV
jgi:perosamine synthetase